MKLDSSFMDELQSRISLAQVVGRKVLWDNKKSQPGKGDLWAPCPFHQEKSASFHVDDRKGFFYCFGCHEKGDAIAFVRKTENVEFMEAVEILAREAGMQMPARDPQAARKAEKRATLSELMEEAVKFFALALRGGAGRDASAYLDRRGLGPEARARWNLGFAPDSWQGLWDHLIGKGARPEEILACGLAKPSSKGGKPYDTFRNRIMFPIRDPRGRCIAFGGRAMDPNDNAKYLNSPETELFDKGRTLFNYGPAREAVGKGAALIVAEGYMDAIALVEAGFGGAVANLGTAVTEHHLDLLWRVSPEPVMSLDGDAAGMRAARKVIDLALPKLQVGRSIRFAILPEGQDPDELIKAKGAAAMQKVVETALPLAELLWLRETEGKTFDSPDRRAALDAALRTATRQIPDEGLRYHYEQALRDKSRELFRSRAQTGRSGAGRASSRWEKGKPWKPPAIPMQSTRNSILASDDAAATEGLREAVILAAIICTPCIVDDFELGLERMECRDARHARLRDLILAFAGRGTEVLHAEIAAALGPGALDELLAQHHVALCPPVRHPGDEEMARMTVAEELAKLQAARALRAEIAEAEEDILGSEDEAMTWRLGQAAQARNAATRSENEDRAEYDLGENGARINRGERSALDALVQSIRYTKPRG
ncbi:DNA primase [Pseudooceanicola sediminis]|uniref:DNA primase n=1 Tax=Pseudooceanicola sediminis TaxID=2211117 RepID=A0A399J942_9RHOB|nr:DNA primase [Pseudooceanicola sediminis]KAA2316256.1 DNA primase [Puniceibacterium sp. HSS470]RII39166.1 DNA primase [Pseudooceanicola sediminis]|tara:strand:+ start:78184 stop:80154 length:1971 start_codon:yes stop_codon:yes gene_type:complete